MSYPVPEKSLETLYEVKKSKFFARAGFAHTREEAMDFLEQVKQEYPDARHHCWAYILGNPWSPASVAMSDDGEPGGTAGKPILNVLQHKGVGDIMMVVTRYFGGIKLGAGGLVRAYSSSAQQTMEQLPTIEQPSLTQVSIQCDFKYEQLIRHWVDEHQGFIGDVQYSQDVTMEVLLPEQHITPLAEFAASLGASLTADTENS
ncbi:YigZ family protein [Hahella sp. CCB-MM4]|uniref:YigZ family protein n=1 Tax=Hahella sp. (strain CCB-MM4) TaxID=1926491 RepID=UPI000B9BA1C9|nr:YigZ family protein [Hahella sp. CCB-MM4]OZG70941.1 YigZ family protein [Hahella sp. CCB-MM4]